MARDLVKFAGTELPPRMRDFAEHYVESGGRSAAASARAVGYSTNGCNVAGSRMLKDARVLQVIDYLCRTRVKAAMALATKTLEELAKDSTPKDAVRLKASQAILDRSGWLIATYSRHEHVHEHVIRGAEKAGTEFGILVRNFMRDFDTGLEIKNPERFSAWCKELDHIGKILPGASTDDAIDADFEELPPEPAPDPDLGAPELFIGT